MKKIGITEPDNYVRNLFEDQTIEFLSSSCFADYYLDQMGDEVEEMLSKDGYCDLSVSKYLVTKNILITKKLYFRFETEINVDTGISGPIKAGL